MSGFDEQNERDAFWDIASLLPSRAKNKERHLPSRDTDTVEINVPSSAADRPYRVEDAVFTEHFVKPMPREREDVPPERRYTPTGSLIHEVRVYPWRTQYDYYETFARHARALLDRKGTPAPFVEFFSYMPQYTQLNEAQLRYYLWWREQFRDGVCLAADYSYLLLYLYELINVGDAMPAERVQQSMLNLWLSYRDAHPRLDALVREWLCDFSLLYGLRSPAIPIKKSRELIGSCRLKEFYVPLGEDSEALVGAVLTFCNNYDYTKSKFFDENTAADYHRVLRGAVSVAISYLRERDGNVLTGGAGISTVSRDAFTGAICSYRIKRRIEVDYTSFSHTHELRYIMSDVLKYAENALRAARGIKSRLSVYAIEVSLRERLDAYLSVAVPKKATRERTKKEEIPDYERRYDLPERALSLTRAAEIEAASWQTTKRLVEAFVEEEKETVDNGVEKTPFDVTVQSCDNAADALCIDEGSVLRAALGALAEFVVLADTADAAAQREYARAKGRMLDAIVDEINTVAGDILGDIILEETDGGFSVIEDYRELLKTEGVL